MTAKLSPFKEYDIIKSYLTEMPVDQIAAENGIGETTVYRVLKRNCVAIRDRTAPVPLSSICAMYNDGIGVQGIADHFGVGLSYVKRNLISAGLSIRNKSEQQFARMQRASPEEIQRLTNAAHMASRGRKKSAFEVEHGALTVQANGLKHMTKSRHEMFFWRIAQERNIALIPQMAIGRYNCDFGTDSIAVELLGGHWHFSGNKLRTNEKRIRYFLDSGYSVIGVGITRSLPFTRQVASYLADLIDILGSNPPCPCEYRMVWGAGKFSLRGCADDDHISIKPPFTHSRDLRTGQYSTIPR